MIGPIGAKRAGVGDGDGGGGGGGGDGDGDGGGGGDGDGGGGRAGGPHLLLEEKEIVECHHGQRDDAGHGPNPGDWALYLLSVTSK